MKNYCQNCQCTTNHNILFLKSKVDDEPNYETKFFVLECMGCENTTFRQENHDYDSTYPDEDNNWVHAMTVNTYPRVLKYRSSIEYYLLPINIRIVYTETIDAIKSNCFLLAGVGFRAVIEAICLDKKIQGRNLETKINSLSRNRLITDKEAERLHAVRFMGNDSVHEIAVPKIDALLVVLEIIEHLLNNLYIIDKHANSHLDTFITEFDDFEWLLIRKLKTYKKDDDFPLAKYLGKDVRRLNSQISIFETELISKIGSGDFKRLVIGDIKQFGTNSTDIFQHFIVA